MAEWEVAANTCPSGPVTSADGDSETYTLIQAQDNLSSLPIKTNTMTSESFTTPDDSVTGYVIVVLQQQDRFLDAVVALQNEPITPAEIQYTLILAKATGQRLAPPTAA